MLPTIQLNHQPPFARHEVANELADRELTIKPDTSQFSRT